MPSSVNNHDPTGYLEQRRSSSTLLPWFIPFSALIAVYILLSGMAATEAQPLRYHFDDAHGLSAGATLRFRGTGSGSVRTVTPTTDGVTVNLDLRREADFLARSGSQFWSSRPELGLTQVSGLDTSTTPDILLFVRVVVHQDSFTGPEQRPVHPEEFAGGTEFILTVASRGGLSPMPLYFFGKLKSAESWPAFGLGDASAVEIRVIVAAGYASLVQQNTRFFRQGGIRVNAGLLSGESWYRQRGCLLSRGVS